MKRTRVERARKEKRSKASRIVHQQHGGSSGTRDVPPSPGNAERYGRWGPGVTLCVCSCTPEGKINQEVTEEFIFGHHCAAGEAPSSSTAQGAAEAGGAAAGGGVTPSAGGAGCAGGGSANRKPQ